MPQLTSAELVVELSSALRDCYLSAGQLRVFLRTKLDRRFDDFASPLNPLTQSISQIVDKANEDGWIADLVREAAEDRPQNTTLRKLLEALPSLDPYERPNPGRSQIDRPSLLCGRAAQWNEVCGCAPVRFHQVLLVPAARGQEPLHFRDRVQAFLTPDPSRTMVMVHWETPPKSLDEMVAALAATLKTNVAGVSQKLQEKLAYQNLVLLHSCVIEGFRQPHVVDYYTKWLPGALAQRTTGSLKCLQPIEWPIQEQKGGFLSRFLSSGRGSPDGRDGALELIAELRNKQAAHVRILDVDELLNLEPRELEQFLEGSEFPLEHQRILLSQLLGGPQVTGYMFKTIDDYWKNIGGRQ